MIKLNRTKKPDLLVKNEAIWENNLTAAVKAYGSYSKIPKDEKDKLTANYRHSDIKEPLFASSFEKCSFCECRPAEGGNIEVEHLKPKSIYPELTFNWENLLPSCRLCNGSKSNHDTGAEPIVNPYDENPKDYFYFKDVRIKPINNNAIASKTIEVCGLNSVRLTKPRSALLVVLAEYSESLEEAIKDYETCDTDRKKENRFRQLKEAVLKIETLTLPEQLYSAYCKNYLEVCDSYQKAKKIVSAA